MVSIGPSSSGYFWPVFGIVDAWVVLCLCYHCWFVRCKHFSLVIRASLQGFCCTLSIEHGYHVSFSLATYFFGLIVKGSWVACAQVSLVFVCGKLFVWGSSSIFLAGLRAPFSYFAQSCGLRFIFRLCLFLWVRVYSKEVRVPFLHLLAHPSWSKHLPVQFLGYFVVCMCETYHSISRGIQASQNVLWLFSC